MKINSSKLQILLFKFSIIFMIFCYGVLVGKYKIFPYKIFKDAKAVAKKINMKKNDELPWYYVRGKYSKNVKVYNKVKTYDGLNLVTGLGPNNNIFASIVTMDGEEIHKWNIDWFKIWANAKHLDNDELPKEKPGTQIHGIVLLKNGDIIFNFEYLGLVRLSKNSEVVWKLPLRTHHSIHADSNGNLWISSNRKHKVKNKNIPNYSPPFIEPVILEVSTDGKIIQEISVIKLLQQNDMNGLLYMANLRDLSTQVSGDTLHLNDVEPFPKNMKVGFFDHDDILISLRNINTILVFNRNTLKIKYIKTGSFVRQHDPDFLNGNQISLFDNNHIAPKSHGQQSRIIILDAVKSSIKKYYNEIDDKQFYTDVMGKHQWLSNGNLLITVARAGRAFEITPNKRIVWDYYNIVKKDVVGVMEEVQRIPNEYLYKFKMQ